jgi:hypothetical protein
MLNHRIWYVGNVSVFLKYGLRLLNMGSRFRGNDGVTGFQAAGRTISTCMIPSSSYGADTVTNPNPP